MWSRPRLPKTRSRVYIASMGRLISESAIDFAVWCREGAGRALGYAEIARRCKVTRVTVYLWRNGDRTPKAKRRKRIERVTAGFVKAAGWDRSVTLRRYDQRRAEARAALPSAPEKAA